MFKVKILKLAWWIGVLALAIWIGHSVLIFEPGKTVVRQAIFHGQTAQWLEDYPDHWHLDPNQMNFLQGGTFIFILMAWLAISFLENSAEMEVIETQTKIAS